MLDRQWLGIGIDIAALDPGAAPLRQGNLEPSPVISRPVGNDFKARLKRSSHERAMLGNTGFAIDVGEKGLDLNNASLRGISVAGIPLLQRGHSHPARVVIIGANLFPEDLLFII